MSNLKLLSPCQEFNNKVRALFAGDKDIEVSEIYKPDEGDESYFAFDIMVRNHKKFMALNSVVPPVVVFGNLSLGICVLDIENEQVETDPAQLFIAIFEGNPHIKDVKQAIDVAGLTHAYVRFKPEVIQFFNDDLSDFDRNWSGLAQDIARDLFKVGFGVHFCTAPANEA